MIFLRRNGRCFLQCWSSPNLLWLPRCWTLFGHVFLSNLVLALERRNSSWSWWRDLRLKKKRVVLESIHPQLYCELAGIVPSCFLFWSFFGRKDLLGRCNSMGCRVDGIITCCKQHGMGGVHDTISTSVQRITTYTNTVNRCTAVRRLGSHLRLFCVLIALLRGSHAWYKRVLLARQSGIERKE